MPNLKEGKWLISIIHGSRSSSTIRSIPMIVKHVDRGGGGVGDAPPPRAPAPPPPSPLPPEAPPPGLLADFPFVAAKAPGVGLAMLYSRRSIGPTVRRVLTQASASRAHNACWLLLLVVTVILGVVGGCC